MIILGLGTLQFLSILRNYIQHDKINSAEEALFFIFILYESKLTENTILLP